MDKRLILVGGHNETQANFYEIVDNNKFACIADKDCNANLKCIGLTNGRFIYSFMAGSDHSKLIVINTSSIQDSMNYVYNVFDFKSNSWIFKSKLNTKWQPMAESKYLFLKNQILIESIGDQINFYDFSYLKEPSIIHQYKLKTKTHKYLRHGMCLLSYSVHSNSNNDLSMFANDNNNNGNNNDSKNFNDTSIINIYSVSFMLYGHTYAQHNAYVNDEVSDIKFEKTFLRVNATIIANKFNDKNNIYNYFINYKFEINDINELIIDNDSKNSNSIILQSFNFPLYNNSNLISSNICLTKNNGQKFIVIFDRRDACLYNVDKRQFIKVEKVCYIVL